MFKSLLKEVATNVKDRIENRRQQQKTPVALYHHYQPLTDDTRPTISLTIYPGPKPSYQQHNVNQNPQINEQQHWDWVSSQEQSLARPPPLPARNHEQNIPQPGLVDEGYQQTTL